MLFALSNEQDRQDFRRYCNELFLWGCEKGGVVEVKKRHMPRSLAQNAYLHVCLAYFASEYGVTIEEAKYEFFKKRYNPEIFVKKRINRKGKEITYVRSSADLDTNEMTIAIESFKNKVAEEMGLVIPDADNRDAIIEAEKQIAKYAEYL